MLYRRAEGAIADVAENPYTMTFVYALPSCFRRADRAGMSGKRGGIGERWLDLYGIWRLMLWQIKTTCGLVVAMAVVGLALAMRLRTEFMADASIRIDRREARSSMGRDNLPSMELSSEKSSAEIALIKSRSVVEQAMVLLNEWRSADGVTGEEESHGQENNMSAMRKVLAEINNVQKSLGVAEVGKDSGVLRLTYRALDAETASNTLRAIIDSYLKLKREHYSEELAKEEALLNRQLPLLKRRGHIVVVFLRPGARSKDLAKLLKEPGTIIFAVPDAGGIVELPLCEEPIHTAIFHVPIGRRRCGELTEHKGRVIDIGVKATEIYALLD